MQEKRLENKERLLIDLIQAATHNPRYKIFLDTKTNWFGTTNTTQAIDKIIVILKENKESISSFSQFQPSNFKLNEKEIGLKSEELFLFNSILPEDQGLPSEVLNIICEEGQDNAFLAQFKSSEAKLLETQKPFDMTDIFQTALSEGYQELVIELWKSEAIQKKIESDDTFMLNVWSNAKKWDYVEITRFCEGSRPDMDKINFFIEALENAADRNDILCLSKILRVLKSQISTQEEMNKLANNIENCILNASQKNHFRVIQLLLKQTHWCQIGYPYLEIPWFWLTMIQDIKTIRRMNRTMRLRSLQKACQNGNVETVECILQHSRGMHFNFITIIQMVYKSLHFKKLFPILAAYAPSHLLNEFFP